MFFLFLVGCQREEDNTIQKQADNDDDVKIEVISFEELNKDISFRDKIEKITSVFDVNKDRKASHKDVFSKDSSFIVLTDKVLKTSTDTTVTYTFKIEKVTDTTSTFENFVIEEINGFNRYFIYKFQRINSNTFFPFSIRRKSVSADQINVGYFPDLFPEMVSIGGQCYEVIELVSPRTFESAAYLDPVTCSGSSGSSGGGSDSGTGDSGGNSGSSEGSSSDEGSSSGEDGASDGNDIGGGTGGADTSDNDDTTGAATGIIAPCDTFVNDCVECEPGYLQDSYGACFCPEGRVIDADGQCVEEVQIINELTGKELCLHDLLEKNGNTFIKDLLDNFKGESEFDIKIESKDKVFKNNEEVNGKTIYTINDNIIRIEINTSLAVNMPSLAVARTILHEYIHADMFRKLYTKYPVNGDLEFKTTFEAFNSGNFEASPSHETMAEMYIDEMTSVLKNFHKNALTEDYNYLTNNGTNPLPDAFYEALAWQGLKEHNVQAYIDLTDDEKAQLQDSLNMYYHSMTKTCPNNN